MPSDARPYDALLIVSFGGPEKPADVLPFLENVTRGRQVPTERLEEVAEHYYAFGGKSPINDQCRELVAAVRTELTGHGADLPVYWGNRNWHPYLSDTMAKMTADGVRRAACLLTSAYASYSGCRQYRENLHDAADAAGPDVPRLDRLRHYFNHPGFVEPVADATVAALDRFDASTREATRIVFVTHSIPEAMNAASGPPTDGGTYVRQHQDVVRAVVRRVTAASGVEHDADLVYCSRSGPPQVPWLEPDVNDHLERLAQDGVPAVVVVPVGFISDHMEVIFDLDTEARSTAERLGIGFARAATPDTDPRFVTMVRELLLERAAVERAVGQGYCDGHGVERPVAGSLPSSWDVCPPGCCANPRGPRRALCGADA